MERLNEREAKQILFKAQMASYPRLDVPKILKPMYAYIEAVEAELTALQSRLAALEEAQRWVPVGEELPKRGNYYLVQWNAIDAKWVGEAFYDAIKKEFRTSFDNQTDHDITHWRKLPDAPGGGAG